MKLFGQSTDNPARALENESAAATARIGELTAQFAATEKKRQDIQNAIAELQRRRRDAE
jgi:chromosome segregation ATPase